MAPEPGKMQEDKKVLKPPREDHNIRLVSSYRIRVLANVQEPTYNLSYCGYRNVHILGRTYAAIRAQSCIRHTHLHMSVSKRYGRRCLENFLFSFNSFFCSGIHFPLTRKKNPPDMWLLLLDHLKLVLGFLLHVF